MAALMVAGLGNYHLTASRHSYGQIVLEGLRKRLNYFSSTNRVWQHDKAIDGWYCTHHALLPNHQEACDITLYKAKSYMNLSGGPIMLAAKKCLPNAQPTKAPALVVIHDELESKPMVVKSRLGGKDRGHRGLESVTAKFKTPSYWRISLGIGRPTSRSPDAVSKHVLDPLSTAEIEAASFDEFTGRSGPVLEAAWTHLSQIATQIASQGRV